jgi:hypothetical protein
MHTKSIARIAAVLLLAVSIGQASIRDHAEFKPADVPVEAAKFLRTAEESHPWWPGRRILIRGTDQGLHFHRKDNGSFWIRFDISLQYTGKRPSSSFMDGIEERKTLDSRDLKNPAFKWKLEDKTQKAIEDIVNSPKHGVMDFKVEHTILVNTTNGESITSRSQVTMTVWSREKALEIISLYFANFPADTLLWEDDG